MISTIEPTSWGKMAESEVTDTSLETQDSRISLAGADGNRNVSEEINITKNHPGDEKNTDLPESMPESSLNSQEKTYRNAKEDPNAEGLSAGEETNNQPRGIKMDALGQMSIGENDNRGSQKQSVADGDCHGKPDKSIPMDMDNGGVGCPLGQTTTEERENGSIEENASPNTEAGNNGSRELSADTVIQDTHDESMEVDVPDAEGENGEPQIPSSTSDQADTQGPQKDSEAQSGSDFEMEVDDVTGQVSAVAQSGAKHAIKGNSEASISSVGELKHSAEVEGDTSASDSDQNNTTEGIDNVPAEVVDISNVQTDNSVETIGESKPVVEGVNDGFGSSAGVVGEPKLTAEENNEGTGSAANAIGEPTLTAKGMSNRASAANTIDELKLTAEGKNEGTGTAIDAIGEPKLTAEGKNEETGSAVDAIAETKLTAKEKNEGTDTAADAIGELKLIAEGKNEGTGSAADAIGDPKLTAEGKNEGTGSAADAIGEPKLTAEGKNEGTGSAADAIGEPKLTAEGKNEGTGSAADAIGDPKLTARGKNEGTDTAANAIGKPKQTTGGKDDDDDSSDDNWYGCPWGRSWASRDTQTYRSGYKVSRISFITFNE